MRLQLAGRLQRRLVFLTVLLLAVPDNSNGGQRRGCCCMAAAAAAAADLYQVLGVPRDADSRTIKKAYRALSLRFHPDKKCAASRINIMPHT